MKDARQYAIEKHGDQKYGNDPYVVHLNAVAMEVENLRDPLLNEEYLHQVALLHDVLEDTEVTREELAVDFGLFVAHAVEMLTDPEGKNRKERKAKLHRRLKQLTQTGISERAALIVKAADRACNIRACVVDGNEGLLKMYAREHAAFRAAVYRQGLVENLWTDMDGHLGTLQRPY